MTMWTFLLLCTVIFSHGTQGQTTSMANSCGGWMYNSTGQFNSPGYPAKYPNNADCQWIINPRNNYGSNIVQLEFSFVNLEGDFSCRYDAISIYDGSSVHSRLLGKLCGGQTSTFHSTGKALTVRFISDSRSNYRGFQASYSIVGGGSCQYNCGYQVGNCSCAYGCERYGECCPDYGSSGCNTATTTAATTPAVTTPVVTTPAVTTPVITTPVVTTPVVTTPAVTTAATSMQTTAQPSCRYNCGSHLGSCSCSSSCSYYGNCCRDYNYYCPTTTAAPTTPQRSCRYNCGNHLGSCSCSSSCQYYGNCCYDYNTYCSSTTPRPTTASVIRCGGSLENSGHFSSPYYPSYYHDNAYCVWYLRAAYNERIFLSFTDLQMENCCGCDYVRVYDGPSTSYSFLGQACQNSNSTAFYSTSNYMTVVFRSDGSVVGRGFSAKFTSTLPSSSGRVDCSSDNMNIVIDRSYLSSLGYNGYNLYLNDQYCRPVVYSNQVIFNFPINTCGTERTFENGRVVYKNAVRAYTSSHGEITRQSHFKLDVGCMMEQDTWVQILYRTYDTHNSTIAGTGRFNGTMSFYTNGGFNQQVTQVPYRVNLNQNLYVQVNLRRDDSSLALFVDTCVASPSPHDFHTRSYDLIRNGCVRDNTYYTYVSGTRSYARFSFQAFQFLRAHESVYLQCKILICQASDNYSRCRRGCQRRKARDLTSSHESHTLVLGPIQLKDFEKQDEGAEKELVAEVKA